MQNEAGTVPRYIRWLAILTGCSTVVFSVSAFGAPFLILGAAIQSRARTTGRWLMWIGALLLSLFLVPLSSELVNEIRRTFWSDTFAIVLLAAIATILVYCCDIALLVEGFRSRRDPCTRGSLDWVVWIVAIILSAWEVWADQGTLYAYQHGFIGTVLTSVGLSGVVLLFDTALIVHAVRTRRVA
jgi:uncharacterized membrane protein